MRGEVRLDVTKVFEVRSGDDGFAEKRRFEDVVTALFRKGAAHEYDGRMTEQTAQFADGVKQQNVGIGIVEAERRVQDSPEFSSLPATAPKRSGLRGATISRQPGRSFCAASTASSSSRESSAEVLAAIQTGFPGAAFRNFITGESAADLTGLNVVLQIAACVHDSGRRACLHISVAHRRPTER